MIKSLLYGVSWLLYLNEARLWNLSYRLTVIEDEEVPLAPGISFSTKFFSITIALMAVILIGIVVSIYYFRCRGYQKRILELKEDGLQGCSGWNLRKLKELLMEIELEVADYE